jgi:hypothetical protein
VSSAADCPQYRLVYQSIMNTHQGVLWVLTRAGDAGVYAPTSSDADGIDVSAFWEVPTDLSECGDSEALATIGTNATIGARPNEAWDLTDDGRDYFLQFDVIDAPGQDDDGVCALSNVEVWSMPRPADTTPTDEWGSGGTDFDDSSDGFVTITDTAATFGLGLGFADVSATEIELGSSASGGTGYMYAIPDVTAISGVGTAVADGMLYRVSIDASSDTVNDTGMWRMVTYLRKTSSGVNTHSYSTDQFAPTKTKNVTDPLGGPTIMQAPAVPKSTGSTVSVYILAHTAVETDAVVTPMVDTYEAASRSWTNWNIQDGHMTVTSLTIEELTRP